jgi:hypothetical protein
VRIVVLLINESLHVGGRPDFAVSNATEFGEKIEIRSRSSKLVNLIALRKTHEISLARSRSSARSVSGNDGSTDQSTTPRRTMFLFLSAIPAREFPLRSYPIFSSHLLVRMHRPQEAKLLGVNGCANSDGAIVGKLNCVEKDA